MVEGLRDGRRIDPPLAGSERAMLESWLDWHRVTLLLKCEDLDDAGRKARPVSTSKLSLHGLVRHMADVERHWFQRVLRRDTGVESIYWRPGAVPDAEFVPLDGASWGDDLAVWQRECDASRHSAADHGLDDAGLLRGQEVSLRWIYLHMIEEYARHNGHADLLREMLDGKVGD